MQMKEDIKHKSLELHKYVLSELNIDNCNLLQHYEESIDLYPDSTSIKESVIIIGMNPSAENFTVEEPLPSPCFLHYINQELRDRCYNNLPGSKGIISQWGIGKSHKKLTYHRYFGPIYKLFTDVEYYPLFVNKEYNDNWIKIYNERTKVKYGYAELPKSHIDLIRKFENNSINRFIIMQDLLPFKDKNSKNIIPLLSDSYVQDKIIEILDLKFKLFKPTLVIQHWGGIPANLKNGIEILLKEKYFSKFISTKFIPAMLRKKETQTELANLKCEINEYCEGKDPKECAEQVGSQLEAKLGLPICTLSSEQSKFFKRHYNSDKRNLGPLVTEMEIIRQIEGW